VRQRSKVKTFRVNYFCAKHAISEHYNQPPLFNKAVYCWLTLFWCNK
jgi:hypothetical protein